jgi:para-nitrobenzyl esterase
MHGRTFLLSVLLALTPAAAARADLVVETESGPVRGVTTDDGRFWHGVPYGSPPVGELRWRRTLRPVTFAEWADRLDPDGVHDASARGPACLPPIEEGTYGSEDCLFLNVAVPPGTAPGDRLPVFVHSHGGANFWGEGEDNPSAFLRHGVVVVTMNYRLGALGLLAHPALSAEGGGSSSNYHLWDQISALEWVRDNIAAFGGDPDNVTLGGFSAGAGNALTLAASPLAHGLFHRVAHHAVGSDWVNGSYGSLEQREFIGRALAGGAGGAGRTAEHAHRRDAAGADPGGLSQLALEDPARGRGHRGRR